MTQLLQYYSDGVSALNVIVFITVNALKKMVLIFFLFDCTL